MRERRIEMRVKRAAAFLALAVLVIAPVTAQTPYTSAAVTADEKAMAAEKTPRFASPQVADPGLQVPGLPEKLTWYTSKPGVWGSSRAKQGGTYHSYITEFPETFRTVGPNANGGSRGYFLTTPSLTEMNMDTKEFMPSMATDWAFGADGKTAYYKLNEKARWSDGTPVTSKDYLFLMKMMRSPNIQDPWYNEYYTNQIVDVKAYGDYVISVESFAPSDPLELLLNTSLSPRPSKFYNDDVPADYVDSYQWKAEPTAGPYSLADFTKGESLTFKKVKDWWGYVYDYNRYRFNIDTIEYKVITGGNDIVRNYFYNGELEQFYQIIPTEWANAVSADPIKNGWIDREYAFYVPLTGVSGIIFNTRYPLFSDVNVRRAMYYAINMQKMIDTVLRGEYSRYHNIGLAHAFGGITFDDDTIRKPDFDPVEAGALLDKAGYSMVGADGIRKNAKGDRVSFELIYASPNHTERLSVLKEEAKKAGVEITLKLMQQGSFTAILEKNFQAWWGGMSTNVYDDYWEFFHSKNADKPQTNNFWGYANKDMDVMLDTFRDTSDLAKKAELDKKIQRLVDQEALVVPNYYVPYYRGGTWKWVRFPAWLDLKYYDDFFEPLAANSGYGGYFGYLWIDSAIKAEVQDAMKNKKAYAPRVYMNETNRMK
jgi:microcin C transport system substrate-binding protein